MNNSYILPLARVPHRHHSLAALRNIIAAIGLTRRQVEAEVAKRFWDV